jgi:E-phenylitaconyl-CoA hydratase
MMNPPVTYEQQGNVVTISYNRPDNLNTINGAMREALNAAWKKFLEDETAWVAILTGAGDTFCAGADLKDLKGSAGTFPGTFWEKPTINSFESGMEIFKPIIAAVNGPCIGYGLTAVTFCDFVVASDRASFAYPEVRIGIPTIVGAIRLPNKLNWSHAIGLVWEVYPHEELLEKANELAQRLCRSAPIASRVTKEVATRTKDMGWVEAVRFGETMRIVASQTEDAKEGRKAYKEKRNPKWQAR